jgi:hypothetical protein
MQGTSKLRTAVGVAAPTTVLARVEVMMQPFYCNVRFSPKHFTFSVSVSKIQRQLLLCIFNFRLHFLSSRNLIVDELQIVDRYEALASRIRGQLEAFKLDPTFLELRSNKIP